MWAAAGVWLAAAVGAVFCAVVLWSVQRVPRLTLRGARVLVTGGSTGIGLETAKALVRRGALVILCARRAEQLLAAKREIDEAVPGAAGKVFFVSLDVGDESAVAQAVQLIETGSVEGGSGACAPQLQSPTSALPPPGPIDVVVCSAGYAYPSRFMDAPASHGRRMMDVNYFGCVNVARAVLPGMVARRRGRLVFVSSMVSRAPIAGYALYAATKAAVRAFAHSLDMEHSCLGVRCQIVNPPDVETPGYAVENETKSPECARISAMSGVPFSAREMGEKVVSGIESYTFQVNLGFDGILLGYATPGMEPPSSVKDLLAEVTLGGVMRLVSAVYAKVHYGIVQSVRQKEAAQPAGGQRDTTKKTA